MIYAWSVVLVGIGTGFLMARPKERTLSVQWLSKRAKTLLGWLFIFGGVVLVVGALVGWNMKPLKMVADFHAVAPHHVVFGSAIICQVRRCGLQSNPTADSSGSPSPDRTASWPFQAA
jgi:hypothetical protein